MLVPLLPISFASAKKDQNEKENRNGFAKSRDRRTENDARFSQSSGCLRFLSDASG
jgi:hypothetical protein